MLTSVNDVRCQGPATQCNSEQHQGRRGSEGPYTRHAQNLIIAGKYLNVSCMNVYNFRRSTQI